jgi:hypothetical protein
MRIRTPLLVTAATATMLAGAALPASAATGPGAGGTATTFTLGGGSLDVTVQTGATLTPGAPGAPNVTGSLGRVDVSDTRGSAAGWIVGATSTAFTHASGPSSDSVSYNSGVVSKDSGTVTGETKGATTINATTGVAVADGTLASGNNTAHFTPDLTVALPAQALAGVYSGTVTTSFV